MAEKSKIQWTDATWNIARGCTKVDADCKFCYMYRDANRFKFEAREIIRTKTVFKMPLKLKTPTKIFTSSLTDVFHEEIDSFRNEMWDIIRKCPQHTFQILTKRPERIPFCLPPDWGDGWDNVWLGTSLGSDHGIQRALALSNVNAKVRFISVEPLYGEVNLGRAVKNFEKTQESLNILPFFDWVIVGGESGNENGKYRYRPCELSWIEKIVSDCKAQGIPVFVKQLGTHLSKKMGLSDRHGGKIDEFPEHLKIRQFPKM